jgi:hypothetical protein
MKTNTPIPNRTILFALALAAGVLPAAAQTPRDVEMENMKTSMENMARTIESLQGEVTKLKTVETEKSTTTTTTTTYPDVKPHTPAPAPTPPPVPLNQVVGSSLAMTTVTVTDNETFLDEQWPAPRLNNAPIDPSLKGFMQIPGTSTIFKVGGSVRLDAIYDFANNGNPNSFIPSTFPVEGDPNFSSTDRSQMSAKGSRLNFELRRPIGAANNLRVYYENDFFGDSSSSAMTYRLRHLYGQAFNILVGQTFSTFMDADAFPDVLDYQGPNGLVNARTPQIRYTHPFEGSGLQWAMALEQPGSQVDTGDAIYGTQSTVINRILDFTTHLRSEDKARGHLQLSGIYRVNAYDNTQKSDHANAWGASLSGGLNVFGSDNLVFQATYGEGIERYIQDTSGLNLDAGIDQNRNLNSIPVVAGVFGYTHKWSDQWKSTVSYGYVNTDPEVSHGKTTFNWSEYATANIIFQPTTSFRMGVEYLYGHKEIVNDQGAVANRINFVIKYDIVK